MSFFTSFKFIFIAIISIALIYGFVSASNLKKQKQIYEENLKNGDQEAAIVNGHKCIGHSLCAEACPVGAITMVMATPSMGADMPYMTQEYETSIENLFIIGELGGLALIKNAVNQGRDCVNHIMRPSGYASVRASWNL